MAHVYLALFYILSIIAVGITVGALIAVGFKFERQEKE
jgi:hypothetical protein